jgi:hypothetical protein
VSAPSKSSKPARPASSAYAWRLAGAGLAVCAALSAGSYLVGLRPALGRLADQGGGRAGPGRPARAGRAGGGGPGRRPPPAGRRPRGAGRAAAPAGAGVGRQPPAERAGPGGRGRRGRARRGPAAAGRRRPALPDRPDPGDRDRQLPGLRRPPARPADPVPGHDRPGVRDPEHRRRPGRQRGRLPMDLAWYTTAAPAAGPRRPQVTRCRPRSGHPHLRTTDSRIVSVTHAGRTNSPRVARGR